MALNPRQIQFAHQYCIDFNATQAAIRAGYSEKTAGSQGHDLLKVPEIAALIEERKEQLAAKAEIDPLWVLRQWKQIATADANELMQLRRVCCRHCHGFGHQYQWTEVEYMNAVNKAVDDGKPAPDGMGGFGYDVNAEPHPSCPECGGLGEELVVSADTRKLKGSARRLYAGVKKTKDGLQILTRDQDAAMLNIARYLGMLVDKRELSGPNGGPIALATLTADDLTDDQLAAILAADSDADAPEAAE
jgi:phage terminase small subunit